MEDGNEWGKWKDEYQHRRAVRKPKARSKPDPILPALMFIAGSIALCVAVFALLILMDVYPLALPHSLDHIHPPSETAALIRSVAFN